MRKIVVISDCDGCLTDGNFIYTADGKVAKIYGAHDSDGVKLLKKLGIDVIFISADKRGFPITNARITDMKCKLFYVSEEERVEWVEQYVKENGYDFSIFFGDGINDVPVRNVVNMFCGPNNSVNEVWRAANYITARNGGQGAFLEFAQYIVKNVLNK